LKTLKEKKPKSNLLKKRFLNEKSYNDDSNILKSILDSEYNILRLNFNS